MATKPTTRVKKTTQAAIQSKPVLTLGQKLQNILKSLPDTPDIDIQVATDFIRKNAKTKDEAMDIARANNIFINALPAHIYYGIDLNKFTPIEVSTRSENTNCMDMFKFVGCHPYFASFSHYLIDITKDWLKSVLIPLNDSAVFHGQRQPIRKPMRAAVYSFKKFQELSGNRVQSSIPVDRNYTAMYNSDYDVSLKLHPIVPLHNTYPCFIGVLESGKTIPDSVKEDMVNIYAASIATKRTNIRHYRPRPIVPANHASHSKVFEINTPVTGNIAFTHADFLTYWQWICELHAHVSTHVAYFDEAFNEFGSPLSDEFMHFVITREIPHALVQTVHALNNFALFNYIVNMIEASMRVLDEATNSEKPVPI